MKLIEMQHLFQAFQGAPFDTQLFFHLDEKLRQVFCFFMQAQDVSILSSKERHLLMRNVQRVVHETFAEQELLQKVSLVALDMFNGVKPSLEATQKNPEGFSNQAVLISLLKFLAAQKSERKISHSIHKYGILDKEALLEIALIAAAQSGWTVSEYIQSYGLVDEAALLKIALVAAAQSGRGVSMHIQKYGIRNEQSLLAIALVAAAQDGLGVSLYIQRYGIQQQEVLVEIALVAAAQDSWGVSEHIQKYGIQQQEALVKIAKCAATNDGRGVSEYIQNYGIQKQEALLEIALLAVAKSSQGVSKYIQNYGITDQDSLVKIAKCAATFDGRGVSEYIQNYGITDQDSLVKIALLAVAQNGPGVSEYIQNYGITDQDSLFKIALLAVAQNGSGVSEYIQNYGIIKESDRWMIARIAILEDEANWQYIGSYQITDQASLQKLFILKQFSSMIQEALGEENVQWSLFSSFFEQVMSKEAFLQGVPPLQKIPDPKKRFYEALRLLLLSGFSSQALTLENIEQVLKEVCSYRNPLLAMYLVCFLGEGCCRVGFSSLYEELIHKGSPKTLQKVFNVNRVLPSILPAYWMSSLAAPSLQNMLVSFLDLPLALGVLKDQTKPVLQRMLLCAIELELSCLSVEQKLRVFLAACDLSFLKLVAVKDQKKTLMEEMVKRFSLIRFISRADASLLDFSDQTVFSQHLEHLLQTTLNKSGIDSSGIDRFAECYLAKFGQMRVPLALETYLGSMNAVQEASVKASLNRFVRSVLQDRFIEERKEHSEHLRLIQEKFPGVLERFHQEVGRVPLSCQEYVVKSTDWEDLFLSGTEVPGSCQRVDGNPSLNKCLLAYCLDGKNALIAVKDLSGKILARAIFRLLLDEKKENPVLFLERIYPDPCPDQRKQAIFSMAQTCAKELQLPLFTQDETVGVPQEGCIRSLRSHCPYEYTDGGGGVVKHGVFEIYRIRRVNSFHKSF